MTRTAWLLAALGAVAAASPVGAQDGGTRPPPDPAMIARLQASEAKARSAPDTVGDGRYPAIKETVASLPDHVVYRPADLGSLGGVRLPIVVWGNGGCEGDGAAQRLHLEEIASHGYLVIANGTIKSGPGAPPQPPRPIHLPGQPFTIPPPETSTRQLVEAIDWAVAQNDRPDSAFYHRLDVKAVAVSGYSCGGIEALKIATSDPRIRTVVIHDSGLFPTPGPGEMDLPKAALVRLRSPIIYILGGPSDIAYANGMDDYARIATVPAAIVNLGDVGHGGTFRDDKGGKAARIAAAWLDWQLKGDAAARAIFVGADCGLCTDRSVSYQSKRLAR